MASNALRAFEVALNVTGNNLANVNTPGYSRQVTEFSQLRSLTYFGLHRITIGSGVFVDNVNRVRDAFLEGRFIQNNFEGSRLRQMFSTLHQVEAVLAEPGREGISDALSAMFDAWNQLSANPADEGARLHLRLQAELFVGRVRDTHGQLMLLRSELSQETDAAITQINRLAERISALNDEIRTESTAGATPNDLLDQRDELTRQLSTLVDVSIQSHSDGTVSIFINQHTLVGQNYWSPLPDTWDAATGSVTGGSIDIPIKGGRLAGLLGGINAVDTYLGQVDTFVNEVRDQINALHETGVNLNGTTLIPFFTGSNGAVDLDLAQEIRDDLRNIAAGTSGAPGDGGLALAIAGLRDTPMAALGDRSPMAYYTNFIGQVGQDTNFYSNAVDTQEALLRQLEMQRQSVSGVNIDEELANMMRYQRSFQAAAKLLSILDQTTDELIRSFGR